MITRFLKKNFFLFSMLTLLGTQSIVSSFDEDQYDLHPGAAMPSESNENTELSALEPLEGAFLPLSLLSQEAQNFIIYFGSYIAFSVGLNVGYDFGRYGF